MFEKDAGRALLDGAKGDIQVRHSTFEGMQTAQIVHAIVGVLFIAAMLAHIYIGTLGMEGAFEAMGTGDVDVNWAKQHHSLWLEEEQARGRAHEPGTRPAATPAVFVEVADDGPGISADLTDRIFNPFFTTKVTGTGLGLAIVRKIVDAHDGRIDVSSTPDSGTRFRVTLPVTSASGWFK